MDFAMNDGFQMDVFKTLSDFQYLALNAKGLVQEIKYETIMPVKELTTSESPDLYSTFRAMVDPWSSPLKMSPAAKYLRTARLVTLVTIKDWVSSR
jgi:hypothetical protein